MGLARFLPSRLRDLLDPYSDLTFNVKAYGAVGDGATDDTAAIQSAIAAASAAGGGTVFFPYSATAYVVNGTLTLDDMSNVALVGAVTARGQYSNPGGVYLKRLSGTGTMLTWTVSAAWSSGNTALLGCRIENISLDGNSLATTGLILGDWYGGMISNVYVRNCTTVNVDLVGGHTTLGFQNNVLTGIDIRARSTATTGIGMRWRSYAAGHGNVSLNTFQKVSIYHDGGVGLDIGDADSNAVYGFECQYGTPTSSGGVGVLLRAYHGGNGHARSNQFYFAQPVSGIKAQGTPTDTTPSANNVFYICGENSVPAPNTETGATFTWIIMSEVGTGDFVINMRGAEFLRLTSAGDQLILRNNSPYRAYLADGVTPSNIVVIDGANRVQLGDSATSTIILGSAIAMNNAVAMSSNKITGLGLATASTDAASLANTLDKFGAPAANVDWNSKKLTGLAAGTAGTDAANVAQLQNQLASALGYAAWSWDPRLNQLGATLSSQAIYGQAVWLAAGTVVTGAALAIQLAGTGTAPTGFYVGLADSTQKILVKSNNLNSSSSLTTLGIQQFAFSATYTIVTSGLYYLVILENGAFGTTAAQFEYISNNQGGVTGVALGANPRVAGVQGGQTVLPAVNSSMTFSGSPNALYWMGAY